MTESDSRANVLFEHAVSIAMPAERRAFLDQQCGDDSLLRQQVESLLSSRERESSILDASKSQTPAHIGPTADYPPLTECSGTHIGPYKLLQKIGEGGFGVVYMAEQEKPVRRVVALKIIKPGMDTAQVIARFESERQALALMDHPNIARVLDAGATNSGQPFFVMDLVKGVPITDFCDKIHMPTEARLKLFLDVCHAIQHAHHKGIIHRDIKPANVMVTLYDEIPVVKVIDFGVAKAIVQKLTDRTLFTAYGQMVGTPAYMSPEQAEMSGLDIDTRSDVYSLGVLLYELLTGTTPLDRKRLRSADYVEMQRIIREEEPPRLSSRMSSLGESATVLAGNRSSEPRQLARLLSGDLDSIVMKALEKDRNRRYATPAAFAEDVERFLRREAVLARPPSTLYMLKRFAQRHRAAALLVALIAGALVVGMGATTWQVVRANRAQLAALSSLVVHYKGELDGYRASAVPNVNDLDSLAANFATLGRRADALKLHEAVVILRKERVGPGHVSTLQSMCNLAKSYTAVGRHTDAVALGEETLTLVKTKIDAKHPLTLLAMGELAEIYLAAGRPGDALKLREAILADSKAKFGPYHKDTLISMCRVAESLVKVDRGPEAVALIRNTVELWEKSPIADANSLYNAACLRAVAAAVLRAAGDTEKTADAEADRALDWLKKAVAAGYNDVAHMARDQDLDALRDRDDYRKLVATLKGGQDKKGGTP